MGRRSTHTQDELRELILTSAREIIESDGLAGLSARTIAQRIGYSPGTLYNVFQNLNDLVLHVEARLLDELDRRLAEVHATTSPTSDAHARLSGLTTAYVGFARERPRLWNLLGEHHLPASYAVPDWYRAKLATLRRRIEEALRLAAPEVHSDIIGRAAQVIWVGLHGMSSLATADKLAGVGAPCVTSVIDDLITSYVKGLGLDGAVPPAPAARSALASCGNRVV